MGLNAPMTREHKGGGGLVSSLAAHSNMLPSVEKRMIELAGASAKDPGAQMVREHLQTGGKRLRARLALSACAAFGGEVARAIDWAAAVELLHNASLIHDDIQDQDRTRRGEPALWARHGVAQAINVGDLLLMLPFRALQNYPGDRQAALGQILAEYAEGMARGQILEHSLTACADKGWDDYLCAVSGKTGSLFALPVRGAAELAGVPADQAAEVALRFSSIGVLYQLQDDVLDLFDVERRGKPGSDIYQGRLSAVVLTHLDLHPSDADEVFAVLRKPRSETTPLDVSQMVERFVEGGAVEDLLDRIDRLASTLSVSDSLCGFPEIQTVASALIDRVLNPLAALRGANRD